MQKSRALILGAGIYQLGLITRARQRGLETHVVSYQGDFPGIKAADHFHVLDTTDIANVLALARSLKPAAVLTSGTDVCVPTIGAICEEMGLPGPSRSIAEIVSRKDRFREFQKQSALRCPEYCVVSDIEELKEALNKLPRPLILKPVDSSGSRGVVRLTHQNLNRVKKVFEFARRFSKTGRVCVERLLTGTEVGGNALLHRGDFKFLGISTKHLEKFLVRGHSYPPTIPHEQQGVVRDELKRLCKHLGYETGALNFDVMVEGGEAWIIEVGARLGGNGLTDLANRAYGYDIEGELLALALGEEPRQGSLRNAQPSGSWVFGSPRKGELTRVSTLEEIQVAVPEVYTLSMAHSLGATVDRLAHNAAAIGYFLFSIPEAETWKSITGRLQNALIVKTTHPGNRRRGLPKAISKGRRVFLRKLAREDLGRTWEWLHQPDVAARIGVTIPFSRKQQEAWFEKTARAADKTVLAVCLKDTGEHIGNVSLDTIDRRHRNARLSIFIASPGLRGKGYGRDALDALLGYAFQQLGLHRVWCKTNTDDPRLQQFYQSAGFTLEGRLRQHECQNGCFVDKWLYGITATEWLSTMQRPTNP